MSDLDLEIYVGTPVQAIRLTAENAQAVADWIEGQYSMRELTIRSDEGQRIVKSTRVYIGSDKRRKGGAWHFGSIGDWFLKDHEGTVRIFPDEKFKRIFVRQGGTASVTETDSE